MSGNRVAVRTVSNFRTMFDLSLSREKMMDMMPGLLIFLARRPEKTENAISRMMPMMEEMGIEVDHDLLIDMMPAVVKAIDMEPSLGGKIMERMVPLMDAFNLKMNFYVIKNVMGLMTILMVKHPGSILPMMKVMPKMMDFSMFSHFLNKINIFKKMRNNHERERI